MMTLEENTAFEEIGIEDFPLFAGLTESQMEWVKSLLNLCAVEKDSIVLAVGQQDTGTGLYFMREGTLRAFTGLPEENHGIPGPGTIFELHGPGGMFGEPKATDDEFPYTVKAVEPARFWWLPQDDFERCCEQIPLMLENLTHALVKDAMRISHREDVIMEKNPVSRIIWQLLSFCDDYGMPGDNGKVLRLRLSHGDLSDMLGLKRDGVDQIIASLCTYGFIGQSMDGYFVIRKEKSLRDYYETED